MSPRVHPGHPRAGDPEGLRGATYAAYVRGGGGTQADAARYFGVSREAIRKEIARYDAARRREQRVKSA